MQDDLISRSELLNRIELRIKDYRHDSNSGAKRIADLYEYEFKPSVERLDSVKAPGDNERE